MLSTTRSELVGSKHNVAFIGSSLCGADGGGVLFFFIQTRFFALKTRAVLCVYVDKNVILNPFMSSLNNTSGLIKTALQALFCTRGKNGFVTATKLGTTNECFVSSTKYFAAATKRFVDRTKHFVDRTKHFVDRTKHFVDRTKHFVVATKYFFIRILTKDFVGMAEPFFPCK